MYAAVRIHPAWIKYVALSPDAKDMAENVYRALWSLLICVAVTVVVSLCTEPKTNKELVGLVWSATKISEYDHVGSDLEHNGQPTQGQPTAVTHKPEKLPLWKTPIFWAAGVAVLFAVLQWMFW